MKPERARSGFAATSESTSPERVSAALAARLSKMREVYGSVRDNA
jgi:hypothetical protein